MIIREFLDPLLSFNSYNRRKWIEEQASQVPQGYRVLDAGAGTGPYRHFFSHCDYRTHDFGQASNTVGQYTHLDYVSDITKIPVPDQSFDIILCTEVLEHLPEPIKAIKEFARILGPKGKLLISAPLGSRLHQEPYHFYGGFTPYWYQIFLQKYGFIILSIEQNMGFFSHFAQEGRYLSTLISPFRKFQINLSKRCLLTMVWIALFPLLNIFFPLLGASLDKGNLCGDDTVGYHVIAEKIPN
jgi:ubiquinone/menaquinone biosynthesis C-methylase UbiE